MTKRKKQNYMPIRTCEFCGKEFQLNRTWQKYCSRDCNQNAFYVNRAEKLKSDSNIDDLLDPYAQSERQQLEIQRRKDLPSKTPEERQRTQDVAVAIAGTLSMEEILGTNHPSLKEKSQCPDSNVASAPAVTESTSQQNSSKSSVEDDSSAPEKKSST